jgi:hypothetical protein
MLICQVYFKFPFLDAEDIYLHWVCCAPYPVLFGIICAVPMDSGGWCCAFPPSCYVIHDWELNFMDKCLWIVQGIWQHFTCQFSVKFVVRLSYGVPNNVTWRQECVAWFLYYGSKNYQVCILALYFWCISCLSHICFVQSRKSLWSQPKCILDLQIISSQLTLSDVFPCTTPWRIRNDPEFFNVPWRTKGSTKLHGFCDKSLISEFSLTLLYGQIGL